MENYLPPFDLTMEMFEKSASIIENLGKLSAVNELERLPRLRKVSKLKSIHSSLAIENNSLSLDQVTSVINGKRVLGPEQDILAVQNAHKAYDMLDDVDPFDLQEMLKVHGVMMHGLSVESGQIRSKNVGVFDSEGRVVHTAPQPPMASLLIYQLFDWIKTSDVPMLIKSCVFHYEFEFIHPFNDGNGRMGRLWQTALLANWKPIFKYIPIESVIKDNQAEYYQAIRKSTNEGRSNAFIVFMLGVIDDAVKNILADSRAHLNHVSSQIKKLMSVMESYPLTAKEIMDKIGIKSRVSFRANYLLPAIEAGLISMTEPDKPTSRNQRYFKN